MQKLTNIGVSLLLLFAFVSAPAASYAQGINAGLSGEVQVEIGSSKKTSSTEDNAGASAVVDAKINSAGVAVVSSAQVNSEADLEIFSENMEAMDTQVAGVSLNSGDERNPEVKVVYRHRGKLFGFIPVTIKSTTVVEAKSETEAEVRSNLSWWNFLVTGKNYAKSEIESRIRNNATVRANAIVNASAQSKARIAEAVIAELDAYAAAYASVN